MFSGNPPRDCLGSSPHLRRISISGLPARCHALLSNRPGTYEVCPPLAFSFRPYTQAGTSWSKPDRVNIEGSFSITLGKISGCNFAELSPVEYALTKFGGGGGGILLRSSFHFLTGLRPMAYGHRQVRFGFLTRGRKSYEFQS